MPRPVPPLRARESSGRGRDRDLVAGGAGPASPSSPPETGGRRGTLLPARRRSAPGSAQPCEEPFAGPEVSDTGGLDPAARGLKDPPLHASELACVVGVAA